MRGFSDSLSKLFLLAKVVCENVFANLLLLFVQLVQFSVKQVDDKFAEKSDEFFRRIWTEKYFAFAEKVLERSKNMKTLCAGRSKLPSVSKVPVSKTLRVFFCCLYSIAIDQFFKETSGSANGQT